MCLTLCYLVVVRVTAVLPAVDCKPSQGSEERDGFLEVVVVVAGVALVELVLF